MTNLKSLLLLPVLLLCMVVSDLQAEMSSANYLITSSVISGGGNVMSSADYHLVSTLGQPLTGNSSSANQSIYSGFWYTMLLDEVGDVNGDGSVNLEDIIAALQIVTGQQPVAIIKEADADGDGRIGIGEAIMILRKLGGHL